MEARAAEDADGIRSGSIALARWLASRDRDLDEATELATVAVEVRDDMNLRRELAAWLESIGEFARAASALCPIASMPGIDPTEAAQVLVRIGILKARSGAPMGAAVAFESALSLDRADPVPCELLGALGGWAMEAVSPAAAAAAYVEAARRRDVLGQDGAKIDDLWRAVAADATSHAAACELRASLEGRGRLAEAEEAWGLHTEASSQGGLGWHGAASGPGEPASLFDRASGPILPRGNATAKERWTCLPIGARDDVERLVRSVDKGLRSAEGSVETMGWLLSQPLPFEWLTDAFAGALAELAHTDLSLAALMARRALDVFGAKSAPLRQAMLQVAEQASDDGFTTSILERWLSCGATGPDRREIFCRLVELRERLGDLEGRARNLARAVREGGRGPKIESQVGHLDALPTSADAALWSLHARAEWLTAGQDRDAEAWAWRDLGAGLWDLADDRIGAIAAWRRATRLEPPPRGHSVFARDLVVFAGPTLSFAYLARLIAKEPEEAAASAIAAAAAQVALSTGDFRIAFDLAEQGLLRCPGAGRTLEIAELASARIPDNAALSRLFELVAARAMGRFGRRAAHYRAARLFERRGEHVLALKHAAQGFQAVPSAGQSFRLLARTAAHAEDISQAVSALERVAHGEEEPAAQAEWLLQAASISNDGEEGARRKFDMLLRAALASPIASTVQLLCEAARSSVHLCPAERDGVAIRLSRVARAIMERIEGQSGARVAIAFAITMLDLLEDPDSAFAMIERAFACGPGVSEFGDLLVGAGALAAATNCTKRTAELISAAEQVRGCAGVPALRLLAAVAAAAGDDHLRSRAIVVAAASDPDDDDVLVAAEEAASRSPALAVRLDAMVVPGRRAEALRSVARKRLAEGAFGEAASLFELALRLVEGDGRSAIERQLLATRRTSGHSWEIEARAQREAANEEASPLARADRWAEIAQRREQRGEKVGAVRALMEACKLDGGTLARWSALERAAEVAEDDQTRIRALEHIVACVGDEGRGAVCKRLARVRARGNDLAATESTWRRVLGFDPDDEEADDALEAAIAFRGGHEDLADHLARRAQRLRGRPVSREELRAVRLRRAAILNQRLGRAEDACEELERLLAEWPEHTGAIRYLADLLGRRGEHARSAALWRRAAAAETGWAEREELDMRAARAAIAAGEREGALRDVRRVLARTSSSARALSADETGAARAAGLTTPRLLAGVFECRLRGARTAEEARRAMQDLTRIGQALDSDEEALRELLLAEAVDLVHGRADGASLESEIPRTVRGEQPDLSVGVAAADVARVQDGRAVDAPHLAVAGPLFNLCRPPPVSVAACSDAHSDDSADDRDSRERARSSSRPTTTEESHVRTLELSVRGDTSPHERASARLALAGARLEQGDTSGAEPLLWEALADGLAESGDVLAPLLASLPERTRDLVRVRRQQAALEPGDVDRLESLRAAATADQDHVYAQAVDHVLRAFDATPLAPPPLSSQPEQPGLLAMLLRPSMDAAGEAYALLWEAATRHFVREAASYGISGVERVVPGPSSTVARLYEAAVRILDSPRIPLFVLRRDGPPKSEVALLSTPSVMLTGNVRDDSSELRFALGRGMAAALPQNALRLGLSPDQGRSLIESLRTAFGPSDLGRGVEPKEARLAQLFWQIVPPRGQRRLQEILVDSDLAGYDELVDRARQSACRLGMFVSGDFACAARAVLAERGEGIETPVSMVRLRDLCRRVPPLADLLRLAISPEYAEARWHAGASITPRAAASSGRTRLF